MLKIVASSVAVLDSNVHTGGGTDVTASLQEILVPVYSSDEANFVEGGGQGVYKEQSKEMKLGLSSYGMSFSKDWLPEGKKVGGELR